ncbi:helix-turn-helix domain-containing protein [Kitasatospora sp. NPDC057518]|uniref:helix-turn-helix domain-containing protein n=1 Tax=Kitasatospora sp. NPDC057518 TaxID=3346155 RepID=UPI00369298A5
MQTPDPRGAAGSEFAMWLNSRLQAAGYDLSTRGGGRSRFAADTGISASSVTRLLNGRGTPDASLLAKIAPALRVTLTELLVRAGVVAQDEIAKAVDPQPTDNAISPQQAAHQLGIESPTAVALFVSMVETMQKQEAQRRTNDREVRRMEP